MITFTPEELEELEFAKNTYEGATTNGQPLIGYDVALRIASDTSTIKSIQRNELLTAFAQIKSDYAFWSQYEWLDTRQLFSTLAKLRQLIDMELKGRRNHLPS